MAGWPGYWEGLPPMYYATHCVSPCLALLGRHAEHVVCHGSGRIDEALIPKYGSPFAIESATFKIRDTDVCAEVTRSLFNVGPAVSRELRRLRQQEVVRVAAGRGRGAGHPHHRLGRARDPLAGAGPRLRPPPALADPTVHDQGGLRRRGRDAPLVHPGRGARRLAPAPRPRLALARSGANARPCPTPRPRRTGPWSASAPTSPP